MLKKEKKGIVIAFLIALLFSGIFFVNFNFKKVEAPLVIKIDNRNSAIIKTVLEIDGKKYETKIKEETSVYDFMDKLRSEGKINFKEKNYLGIWQFIEEINGVKGNGDKSWIYYVNEKKANIGVSNYKLINGDIVSWKYEENI